MKCHLNRMTAALVALVLLSIPIAAQAAPGVDRTAVAERADDGTFAGLDGLWERLWDGLAAVFANSGGSGSGGDPDDGEVSPSFDPDGYTWSPEDGGNASTVSPSFDPDG